MILIKEVILCQVVIAHWAIFEMTFIDTDERAQNFADEKRNWNFKTTWQKKKKSEQCQQVIWRRNKKVQLKIEFRIKKKK